MPFYLVFGFDMLTSLTSHVADMPLIKNSLDYNLNITCIPSIKDSINKSFLRY